MKVLHVVPSLASGFGGPSTAAIELCRELVKQGLDVSIFTTDADIKGRLRVKLNTVVDIDGIKVIYFPVQFFQKYKFSLPLAKALRERIPFFDIIHIHSLFQFSTCIASYYCRKYQRPYIIRPLGHLDPFLLKRHRFRKFIYMSMFERKNLKHSSLIHFTTESERRLALSAGIEYPSFVVPMGIDLKRFSRLPLQDSFRLRYPELKNKKILLFLGRINFKKGLDILVRAFAYLLTERDDVHLVIAGPDDEGYSKKIKKFLKKEDILDMTTFTGMLLGEDKLAAFRDSEIFALPSYSENFGLSVVEAMACGTPAVISNKVGIYKELEENRAGLIVETDPESLLEGIQTLLDDEALRIKIAENGKKFVKEYFDIEKIAGSVIEIYRKVVCKRY